MVVAIDGTASFVDCRTASCSAVAISYQLDVDGPVVVASAPLSFNPAGALRTPPSLAATPATNLVDGQHVDVSVTPVVTPKIKRHHRRPMCGPDDHHRRPVAADAVFVRHHHHLWTERRNRRRSVAVRSYIETPTGPVDCRAVTATCVLFTFDPVFQTSNVPLTFDPNGSVAPAFLTRPSADPLDPTSPTTYDLVGFTPGDPFTVQWCNAAGACLRQPWHRARSMRTAWRPLRSTACSPMSNPPTSAPNGAR